MSRITTPVALSVTLVLVAFLAGHPLFSIDFFWHLALGDVIHARGRIPGVDLFSAVHPDRPYVQFNWLWDLLASRVHASFGLRGIRVAQTLCISASFGLLYAVVRRRLRSPELALAVTALCLALLQDRFRARPDALTLGFGVAILPLLLGGYRRAGRRTWAMVFGLGVLWSNIHGGTSLLLPLSLGALLVGAYLRRVWLSQPEPLGPVVGLTLAAIGGIACSPTLLPGLVHWLHAVQPQMELGNQEWLPSYTMLRNGVSVVTVIVGLGPTAIAVAYLVEQGLQVRRNGLQRADPGEWLLCAGYLVLAHHAVRNAFLCYLPVVCMLAHHVDTAAVAEGVRRRVGQAALAVAALLLIANFAYALDGYGGYERMRRIYPHDLLPGTFPTHAADFMTEAGIEGPVNNDGRWGGYLIHRLWPRCGILIDTRHNITGAMWRVMQRSHDPIDRPRGLQEGFARYGLELSIHRGPTFPLVRPDPGWVLLYKAGDEEVYQHVKGAHAQQNIAHAAAWLGRHAGQGATPSAPGSASYRGAVTRLGADVYLRDLLPQERAAYAGSLLGSRDAQTQARGHRVLGRLRFDVGDYGAALADYLAAAQLQPMEPRAPLLGALSAFALGRDAEARRGLSSLASRPVQGLRPLDRARAGLLRQRLGVTSPR